MQRKNGKKTQIVLAKIVRCTPRHINAILKGSSNASPELGKDICRALCVDPDRYPIFNRGTARQRQTVWRENKKNLHDFRKHDQGGKRAA